MATAAATDQGVLGGDAGGQLEAFGEQLVGHQEGVALIGSGNTEVTAAGMDGAQELGHPVLTPVGRGLQLVGRTDLVRLTDGYVARLCHLSSVPSTAASASRLSAFPGCGVDETVDDRVEEGLPGGFDDVLRDADRRPDDFAVGGVDEDAGDRPRAPAGVEDPDPVVDQVDAVQNRIGGADGLAQGRVEGVDRSVALGRGHHPGVVDPDLHRGLGQMTAVAGRGVGVVGDDPERLQLEEVGFPTGGPAQQQLEGAVGHLEVVAPVLEGLECLEDAGEGVGVELQSELLGLEGQGGSAGHLRHDEAGAVADRVGRNVLVGVAATGDGARVETGLVGESGGADVGLLGVGGHVDQLGDVVGDGREAFEAVGRDGADVELQREVGDGGRQIGVTGALAVAVDAALDVGGAGPDGGDGVGHGAAGVVVEMDADLALEIGDDAGHDPLDVVGHGPAVGVAQDEGLDAGLLGRPEDPEAELGVVPVAVEEVFGVEEHSESVLAEEGHRLRGHGDGFVQRGAQGLGDVHLRRLGHDADGFGVGLDQVAQNLVVFGTDAGPPGRAEGHQGGGGQAELGRGPGEELLVLGIGPRPAALDEGHAQMVELLGHPELVVHRERQTLLLGSVAEGGVEDVHRFGQDGEGEGVAGGVVAVALRSRRPLGRPAATGHVRASPCSGRPRRGRRRSRSAGSAW